MTPATPEEKQDLSHDNGDLSTSTVAGGALHVSSVPPPIEPGPGANRDKRISSSPDIKTPKPPQPTAPSLKPNISLSQSSLSSPESVASPSVINKQLLSKLNKSLKEKQKVITQNISHSKTPTNIQDGLSTSPKFNSTGPSGLNPGHPSCEITAKATDTPEERSDSQHIDSETIPSINSPGVGKELGSKSKAKNKRIAKQNSTRTDFFAAKLASAVDDVESSDSDGTFVYETNAPEMEEEDPDNSGTVAPEHGLSVSSNTPHEDQRSAENINKAPASIHLVNDNISFSGSYRGANNEHVSASPTNDSKKDDEVIVGSILPQPTSHASESVASLQSSKNMLARALNSTPPLSGRATHNFGSSFGVENSQYPDPFLDNLSKYSRHPTRKNSTQSMFSDDHKSSYTRSPKSPYREAHRSGNSTPIALTDHAHNISEPFTNAMYCYREEDVSGDECSSHGDIASMNGTDHQVTVANVESKLDGVSSGKPPTNKASTTSSKLRSTTSKLFDKKGAQPRRYSTIPDDIDIEDFDDELIYYDNNNNIRFPYNRSLHSGLNESSSLLGDHKLPHYKSLNLSYGGKRAPSHLKNKRYSSMGYVPPPQHGYSPKKNDPFPFPYPQNGETSYYRFRECEEDSHHNLPGDLVYTPNEFQPLGKKRSLLSTKISREQLNNDKFSLVKSVIYTLLWIFGILIFGFVSGFLFASAKDLSNISIVSIENALVTSDELVFSVVIEALNPGWFTVTIDEIELDIFAKSGYLDDPSADSSIETVLLGSVFGFESALNFEGSFFNRHSSQQTGEVKLVSPGKNLTGSSQLIPKLPERGGKLEPSQPADNAEKWRSISKHPFDLILRGILKYKLAINHNTKSVVVNKVGYIDPSRSG